MATGKKYYWMKLSLDFMTSDTVDFLMEQPDGANYVVLYQMLCLKTLNTGGHLSRQLGEIIIPYDEKKIARDTKWFSIDTVRVALNLYKALGLIYEGCDGCLALSNYEKLVGSETDWATQKKEQRTRNHQKVLAQGVDIGADIVHIESESESDSKISDLKILDGREKKEKGMSGAAAPTPSGESPEPKAERHKYGEYGWVRLSDDEYNRLLTDLGKEELQRCITYIDESAQSNGNKNKWKDWNLVIRKCSKMGWGKARGTSQRPSSSAGAMGDLQQLHQIFGAAEGS